MTKHTPGPWLIRPKKYDDWGWVRAENGELVATARAGEYLTEEQLDAHRVAKTDPYEANARLIASAPELLEALKWALPLALLSLEECRQRRLQAGHSDIQAGEIIGLWPIEVAQRDQANAALAKATA